MFNHTRTIAAAVAAVLFSLVALSSFATVPEGTRGVHKRFGEAQEQALDPGLHVLTPFVSSVSEVDVRQRLYEQTTTASTLDQQTVSSSVAVNYHAAPSSVVDIYSNIGPKAEVWDTKIVAPQIAEVLKMVTASYTALELVTKRAEVKGKITDELTARIELEGFNVDQVSITNFRFSSTYEAAIEAKVKADQERQQAETDLERNATEVKALEQRAEAEAASEIARANGDAEALRIRAAAQAEYHKTVSAAATPASLRQLELEKWDGKAPLYVGTGGSIMLPSSK